MSKEKAQAFFEKKKAEVKSKQEDRNGDGKIDAKDADTSKMPPQLKAHYEKKHGMKK